MSDATKPRYRAVEYSSPETMNVRYGPICEPTMDQMNAEGYSVDHVCYAAYPESDTRHGLCSILVVYRLRGGER